MRASVPAAGVKRAMRNGGCCAPAPAHVRRAADGAAIPARLLGGRAALAAYADTTFYVETGGVTILRSVSAFISVVQALATAVALRKGTSSRSQLLTDERLLDALNIYVDTDETATPRHRDEAVSVTERPAHTPRATKRSAAAKRGEEPD